MQFHEKNVRLELFILFLYIFYTILYSYKNYRHFLHKNVLVLACIIPRNWVLYIHLKPSYHKNCISRFDSDSTFIMEYIYGGEKQSHCTHCINLNSQLSLAPVFGVRQYRALFPYVLYIQVCSCLFLVLSLLSSACV